MNGEAFRAGLLEAYLGERAAAVTLRQLVEEGLSDRDRDLAELFIALETAVAERLEPLVRSLELPVELDGERIEQACERARRLGGWHAVVATLDERLADEVAGFDTLREAARSGNAPENTEVFDLLVEHEIALMRFGSLLRTGREAEGKEFLETFIQERVRSRQKRVSSPLEAEANEE